jgi:hypothetical protein
VIPKLEQVRLRYSDPSGMRYTICDTSGNCHDDYSDADFDKNLGGTSKNGVIYDNDDNQIGTYQRTSFDDLSPIGNSFFGEMSNRRQGSNQMIAAVGAGSAAVGIAGGVATATGTVAAVIDGVAYTYEQLVALGPKVIAKLIAAGKLTQETIQRLATMAPQLMTQAGNCLFARGGQGLLNGRFTGDWFRVGYSCPALPRPDRKSSEWSSGATERSSSVRTSIGTSSSGSGEESDDEGRSCE